MRIGARVHVREKTRGHDLRYATWRRRLFSRGIQSVAQISRLYSSPDRVLHIWNVQDGSRKYDGYNMTNRSWKISSKKDSRDPSCNRETATIQILKNTNNLFRAIWNKSNSSAYKNQKNVNTLHNSSVCNDEFLKILHLKIYRVILYIQNSSTFVRSFYLQNFGKSNLKVISPHCGSHCIIFHRPLNTSS